MPESVCVPISTRRPCRIRSQQTSIRREPLQRTLPGHLCPTFFFQIRPYALLCLVLPCPVLVYPVQPMPVGDVACRGHSSKQIHACQVQLAIFVYFKLQRVSSNVCFQDLQRVHSRDNRSVYLTSENRVAGFPETMADGGQLSFTFEIMLPLSIRPSKRALLTITRLGQRGSSVAQFCNPISECASLRRREGVLVCRAVRGEFLLECVVEFREALFA